MPAAAIRSRGGARKVRTKKLPGGRYVHIYVVGVAGPRGGHSVAGEVKRKKPSPDTSPAYKVKPDIPKRKGQRSHGRP